MSQIITHARSEARDRVGRELRAAKAPGVTCGTRVVVTENDVLLREGIVSLLIQRGFDVVGRCGDAAGLLALVRREQPDLVIVEICMPSPHATAALDAARAIRAELPDTAVLVLSSYVELEATDFIGGGPKSGYLLKERVTNIDDFVEALDRIVNGGIVVDPALVQALVAARRSHDPLDRLSSREREVLACMAEGRSNAGIARALVVTEGTIEKHVHSILMKLRVPEAAANHRRVLAVLVYLEHARRGRVPTDRCLIAGATAA